MKKLITILILVFTLPSFGQFKQPDRKTRDSLQRVKVKQEISNWDSAHTRGTKAHKDRITRKWGAAKANRIVKGEVMPGDDYDTVREAIGYSDKNTYQPTKDGTLVYWWYLKKKKKYCFKDGFLIKIDPIQ